MGSASARARKHGSMQRGACTAPARESDVGIVAIDADGFRRLPTKKSMVSPIFASEAV